jgi:hypothetical protein
MTPWGYRETRPASRGGSQPATLSKTWIIELKISTVGKCGTPVRQSLGVTQAQERAEGGLGYPGSTPTRKPSSRHGLRVLAVRPQRLQRSAPSARSPAKGALVHVWSSQARAGQPIE